MMPDDLVWTNEPPTADSLFKYFDHTVALCLRDIFAVFFPVVGLQLSLLRFWCHIHKVSVYIPCAQQHVRHCF